MSLLSSGTLLHLAFIAYLVATGMALLLLAVDRQLLRRLVGGVAWAGLVAHTAGLLVRWIEAGHIELAAAERSLGVGIAGWNRWSILLSHPPFTNLYESLVFFAWSLVLVTLVANAVLRGQRFWVLGVLAMVFADLSMGLASLAMDRAIAPLVPALQSWWLYLHVLTAFLGYACFLLAAVTGVLYLVSSGMTLRTLGGGASICGLLAVLALGSGLPWPLGAPVRISLLGDEGACRSVNDCTGGPLAPYDCIQGRCLSRELCDELRVCPGRHDCREGRCAYHRMVEVTDANRRPVGIPLPDASVTLLAAALMFLLAWCGMRFSPPGLDRVVGALGLSLGMALLLVAGLGAWREAQAVDLAPWRVRADLFPTDVDGSLYLSLRSAAYRFAMLVFAGLVAGFGVLIALWRRWLEHALPPIEVLDRVVYRSIQYGFPLMTLTIVTGAVWAHYAWGRFWGWDPKETWSLITWFVYAGYLHARIVHGWRGRRAAALAVLGFAVVIFTFLGVNMGLTGAGLHTYGGNL